MAPVDFFISYTAADRSWAEWIGWAIEESGNSVRLQAWDFQPGHNFVLQMQRAVTVQHGGKRQWITLETGTLSRFKPAPHHARKRQWITQQSGTSGRGKAAPASGRGSLLAGD